MFATRGSRGLKRSLVSSRRLLLCLAGLVILYLIFTYVKTDQLILKACIDQSEYELHFVTKPKSDSMNDRTSSVIGDRFKQRALHLKLSCKNKSLDIKTAENDVKSHLIVDDKYHLVYCFIEKIGCTFWKRVFQILNGFKNVTDPFQTNGMAAYGGYKTAEQMPFYRINYIFGDSTKFLFVREPYERLLSGYVDKVFLPLAPYWLELGQFIIKTFRPNTNASVSCGSDVTFEEFVKYFIYSQENYAKRDVHFYSNYDHCRPCDLDYDYIGKLETFEEDTMFLLKELKLNQTVQIKNFEEKTERDAIIDAIDWSYTVQASVDSCIPRSERLYRTFRKLQIRGMISKHIPYPFSRAKGTDVETDEYKQAFLDKNKQSQQETRKFNRKEAFMEAYSSLSRDLLLRLREHLRTDAELFGYETNPDILTASESYIPDFHYFDLNG